MEVDTSDTAVLSGTYEVKEHLILNPIALRKAKIVYNFGLFECNRVKVQKKKEKKNKKKTRQQNLRMQN